MRGFGAWTLIYSSIAIPVTLAVTFQIVSRGNLLTNDRRPG
jgi:hypothetical protein